MSKKTDVDANMWRMAKVITERQRSAVLTLKEKYVDSVDWAAIEETWFDWLETMLGKQTYTYEDMRLCFEQSRLTHPMAGFKHDTFEEFLSSISQ